MLRLYIMRHAKSSWAVPGARDFERELNERGRSDLVRIAKEISRKDLVPEKVLCSSAIRTRQTLECIEEALQPAPQVEYMEKLYSGGMEDYLNAIRKTSNCSSLMIIGHNPMSGSLAHNLAGSGDEKAMEKIAYKYPTSTIAVLEFDTDDWSDIAPRIGNLLHCIIPSKLTA